LLWTLNLKGARRNPICLTFQHPSRCEKANIVPNYHNVFQITPSSLTPKNDRQTFLFISAVSPLSGSQKLTIKRQGRQLAVHSLVQHCWYRNIAGIRNQHKILLNIWYLKHRSFTHGCFKGLERILLFLPPLELYPLSFQSMQWGGL
jgi:hypothetical protein